MNNPTASVHCYSNIYGKESKPVGYGKPHLIRASKGENETARNALCAVADMGYLLSAHVNFAEVGLICHDMLYNCWGSEHLVQSVCDAKPAQLWKSAHEAMPKSTFKPTYIGSQE